MRGRYRRIVIQFYIFLTLHYKFDCVHSETASTFISQTFSNNFLEFAANINLLNSFDGVISRNIPKVNLKQLVPVVTKQNIAEYIEGLETGDQDLNITELFKKYGYRTETHRVKTEDGFILTIFRVSKNTTKKGTPIYVEHGFMSSSDDFVTLGPKKALAYQLANSGHDVWLGNARGNKHSQEHERLTPEDDKFWDFTLDDIGRYDLPACIDYILNVTGREQLIYIGHSQGTTVFFILCSERPEYNKKVLLMIALSAVVFMSHTSSPVFRLTTPIAQYYDIARAIFGPSIVEKGGLETLLKPLACEGNLVANILCTNIVFKFTGFDNGQLDFKALPTIVSHSLGGVSTKQLSHFAQLIVSGKFRKFDYYSQNKDIYGTDSPPDYPLEKIKVPMALFHANSDWVSVDKDLKILLNHLTNNVSIHRVPYDNFNHADYFMAKDAPKLLYEEVLRVIKFHNI